MLTFKSRTWGEIGGDKTYLAKTVSFFDINTNKFQLDVDLPDMSATNVNQPYAISY